MLSERADEQVLDDSAIAFTEPEDRREEIMEGPGIYILNDMDSNAGYDDNDTAGMALMDADEIVANITQAADYGVHGVGAGSDRKSAVARAEWGKQQRIEEAAWQRQTQATTGYDQDKSFRGTYQ